MSIERPPYAPEVSDTRCRNCPRRAWLQRVLDFATVSEDVADDCRGPVAVHHNKIVERHGDALRVLHDHRNLFGDIEAVISADRPEYIYKALVRARGREVQCGREPVALGENEYLQDPDADPRPWSDGMRHVVLVKGEVADVKELREAIARQGHVGWLSDINLR